MLQVCYVVVAAGWDRHAQMAWLSAMSVRLQDPAVQVVLVLEAPSAEAEELIEAKFEGVAHRVLRKKADVADPVMKSRLHRLLLRGYVSGDILYVDSDTLAVGKLCDVADTPADVGAVMDFNHDLNSTWCPPELKVTFEQHGWQYPLPRYFNAGVIFMRDTKETHALCHEWLSRWKMPSPSPQTWDQPTFNSALFATRVTHVALANDYNAMVVKRLYSFKTARLLHFFGSAEEQRGTLIAHLMDKLEATGTFDEAAYRLSIRQRHPWGPDPEPWQLYHSRNYARAAFGKARSLVERLFN